MFSDESNDYSKHVLKFQQDGNKITLTIQDVESAKHIEGVWGAWKLIRSHEEGRGIPCVLRREDNIITLEANTQADLPAVIENLQNLRIISSEQQSSNFTPGGV